MPQAAVFTVHKVRVMIPNGDHATFPVFCRTWPDALTTIQIMLLTRGIRTSRRDRR